MFPPLAESIKATFEIMKLASTMKIVEKLGSEWSFVERSVYAKLCTTLFTKRKKLVSVVNLFRFRNCGHISITSHKQGT